MAERWIGEPELMARPPKESPVERACGAAKAGRTAASVVKMVVAFILALV